jgi:rubrerythrin
MTTSDDRLDRIEALLERTAQQQAAHAEAFSRIQEQQSANTEAISRLQEQQSTTDDIIRASIADVVEMISDLGRQQQETDQRFNTLLADSRADRLRADAEAQENRREHREFRTFMRDTIQELRRVWQRIAG